MSDERLEQIHARAAAATPGPWEAWDTGDPPAEDEAQAWIVTPGSLHLATLYAGDPSANATFAAHAREDIPALLAEVERLRSITTITDEMVERGAEAFYHGRGGEPGFGPQWDAICADWPEIATVYRRGVRAALEAALGGGES